MKLTIYFKHNIYILFTVLFFFVKVAVSQTTINPDDSNIQYSGRIDFSNANAPQFNYSGVSIKAGFNGTSITLKLNAPSFEDFYYIIIDEGVPYKLKISNNDGTNEYVLAEGLTNTNHIVEIIRLYESESEKVTFQGFILDSGTSLYTLPSAPNRIIEFIGDSITCGNGVEFEGPGGSQTRENTNYYKSYASFTARSLNAQNIAVSNSGTGVYRNWGGDVDGSTSAYQNNYHRIFFNRSAPLWDFSKQIPDVVCINLGTNDFSTSGYKTNLYEDAYENLISQVRTEYPLAKIVMVQGPMMSNNKLTQQSASVNTVLSRLNDPNLSNFEMSQQTGDLGHGAGWHPSELQHIRNSNELTIYLSNLMNWDIYPTLVYAKAENIETQVDIEFNIDINLPANAASNFKVHADGTIINVASISGSNKNYKLTLSNPIGKDQKVGVSYNPGNITYQGNEMKKQGIEVHNLVTKVLSVNDLKKKNNVNFFPNPTKNILNIKAQGEYTALIYDINGKLIKQKKCSDNSLIKTNSLKAGAYIVKIKSDTNIVTKKLIIN